MRASDRCRDRRADAPAARDATKDQSYFLFALGATELARTRFPVGELTKVEVRAEARRLGLPVADKPDSMEVCFVPHGDTAAFVAGRAPEALRKGPIVDDDGTVVGTHEGIHRFTVGQRRGLALGGGARRYVRALDVETATVTVTGATGLRGHGLPRRRRPLERRHAASRGHGDRRAHPPPPSPRPRPARALRARRRRGGVSTPRGRS